MPKGTIPAQPCPTVSNWIRESAYFSRRACPPEQLRELALSELRTTRTLAARRLAAQGSRRDSAQAQVQNTTRDLILDAFGIVGNYDLDVRIGISERHHGAQLIGYGHRVFPEEIVGDAVGT